jgi:5'-3' exoribonuclease 2
MGVPAFFRWLTIKYPEILNKFIEDKFTTVDGQQVPFDSTKPNPNGVEFDCLYLDMNGLVHPCCHPEGKEAPKTEHDMCLEVFKELDRIFAAVRPRKLIFMALDGVAPRAKQNQQRSRRFKSAREAKESEETKEKLRNDFIKSGKTPPPRKKPSWDHNVITPGTNFMDNLSKYLRFYIHKRLTNNPAWKDVTIIFSDSNTPGEGEHKIMEFIRLQRVKKGYNPNLKHVIHGLDADLIMLALATHEANFYILREEVIFGRKKVEKKVMKTALVKSAINSTTNGSMGDDANADKDDLVSDRKQLEIVTISVLREYLAWEFRPDAFSSPLPFEYDLERIVDDFVFICFFVGNDFLPHLPSLDIREGALDLLMDLYRQRLPALGGYLSDNGEVNLQNASVMLGVIGEWEDVIFQKRQLREEEMKRRREQNKAHEKMAKGLNAKDAKKGGNLTQTRRETGLGVQSANAARQFAISLGNKKKQKRKLDETEDNSSGEKKATATMDEAMSLIEEQKKKVLNATKQKKNTKREVLKTDKSDGGKQDDSEQDKLNEEVNEKDDEVKKMYEQQLKELNHSRTFRDDVKDTVKLGEEGWKKRYYTQKFGDELYEEGFTERLWGEYTKGLCWVLAYYYKGCASWSWYYPFHYAPFASDLKNLEQYAPIKFDKSTPFSPITQLMAVLPPRSSHCLPTECRALMQDPDSPIIDFYPENFKYDPNGKPVSWLWIVLLPFLDEKRLIVELDKVKETFSAEETKRDQLIDHTVYVHQKSEIGKTFKENLKSESNEAIEAKLFESSEALGGLIGGTFKPTSGKDHPLPSSTVKAPDNGKTLYDLKKTSVIVAWYTFPVYEKNINKLLPDAKIPKKQLSEEELMRTRRYGFGGRNSIAYLAANSERDSKRNGGRQVNRSWGSAEPQNKKMRYNNNNNNNNRNKFRHHHNNNNQQWQRQQNYNARNGLAPAGRGMVSVAYPGAPANNNAYNAAHYGSASAYPGATVQYNMPGNNMTMNAPPPPLLNVQQQQNAYPQTGYYQQQRQQPPYHMQAATGYYQQQQGGYYNNSGTGGGSMMYPGASAYPTSNVNTGYYSQQQQQQRGGSYYNSYNS